MKQYLIRSGIDFSKRYGPNDVFYNRLIAGNSGNMMFIYGIMNVLTTSEYEVVPTFYKLNYTQEEIDEINSKYEAFLIPLADAFRSDFMVFLNQYTELIRKLKIPCILMSAGIKAPLSCNGNVTFSFDNDVKAFLNAILNHSSVIGIRGEITGRYLEKLGYIREKHFTVIGCPSLYTYGDSIQIDSNSPIVSIGFGLSPFEGKMAESYFNSCIEKTERSILLFQLEDEFRFSYMGIEPSYFHDVSANRKLLVEGMEKEGRTCFFYDVPEWLSYLRDNIDVFVGDRFHGAVSSVLASKKHIIVPIDARTRELAEYHDLTRIYERELDFNNPLDFSRLDFNSFEVKQKENLNHYIQFLRTNNLNSVFDDSQIDISPGKSPFERKLGEKKCTGHPFKHYCQLNNAEKMLRLLSYNSGRIKYAIKSRLKPELRG